MPNRMQTAKTMTRRQPAGRFFGTIMLPMIAWPLLITLTVCAGDGKATASGAGGKSASGNSGAAGGQRRTTVPASDRSVLGQAVSPYATGEEAASLAYKEALKWRPDAVLAYLSPDSSFMDFDFMNTGLATRWGMEFANRANDSQLFIHIVCRKVDYTRDLGNKRRMPLNAGLKVDRPVVSSQQAMKVALDNGAPKGMLPAGVYYRIEPDAGKTPVDPRWLFSFLFEIGNGLREYHFYAVNALTGVLYQPATGFVQQPGSNRLTANQLKYKPGYVAPDNEERAIRKFYGLMNRRSFDEAFRMMDPSLISGSGAKDMWKSTYDKDRFAGRKGNSPGQHPCRRQRRLPGDVFRNGDQGECQCDRIGGLAQRQHPVCDPAQVGKRIRHPGDCHWQIKPERQGSRPGSAPGILSRRTGVTGPVPSANRPTREVSGNALILSLPINGISSV